MTQTALKHNAPMISVIVPVFNGEAYLGEALQSIVAQDYRPLQVLVVDDGSTDHSAALAETFPDVQVLRKEHSGLAATLNHGIAHATGDLLAFLDADDVWLPDKLTCQIAELQKTEELDMVFCHVQQFQSVLDGYQTHRVFSPPQPGVHKIGLLIWRSSLTKAGAFSEDADRHDFLDWYARACGAGLQSSVMPAVLALRRIHKHNLGRQDPAAQRARYLRSLRDTVAQRKAERAEHDNQHTWH